MSFLSAAGDIVYPNWIIIRELLLNTGEWNKIDDNTIETDTNAIKFNSNNTSVEGIPQNEIGGEGGGVYDIPWYSSLNGSVKFTIVGGQGGQGSRGSESVGGEGGRTEGSIINLSDKPSIRLVVGGGGDGSEGVDNVPGVGGGQSAIIVPGRGTGWDQRIVVSGGGGGAAASSGGAANGGLGGGAGQNGEEGIPSPNGGSEFGSGGGATASQHPVGGSDVAAHGEFGYAVNASTQQDHTQDRAFGGGGLGNTYESGGGGGGYFGGGVADFGGWGGSGGGGSGYADSGVFNVSLENRDGFTDFDKTRSHPGYMKLEFTG